MILINELTTHEKQKEVFLERIEDYKNSKDCILSNSMVGIKESKGTVYSDYQFSVIDRLFKDDLFEHKEMRELLGQIGYKLNMGLFSNFNVDTHDAWFQQYENKAEHTWHNHSGYQFTNLYFLELHDTNYKTEICGLNGKLIEYEAKEGEVLTMPSFLLHRSKPNGSERKTIISFNTSYRA